MKTTLELITPEKAFEMLKMNTANRHISKVTINFYADQMEKGEWKTTSQGIAISDDNKIIDGQHRLMAIVKSKIPQNMYVTRGLDYEEVFAVYDTGKNRTAGDVLSIKGVKNASSNAAALKIYVGLKRKHKSIRHGSSNKWLKLSNKELMDIYMSQKKSFDNIDDYVLKGISATTKIIPNSIILGISYYLVIEKNHDIDKVRSFFIQLINGKSVENETINVLRNKIIETRLKGDNFRKQDHLVYIKKTWNSYINDKELTKFYISALDRERDFI